MAILHVFKIIRLVIIYRLDQIFLPKYKSPSFWLLPFAKHTPPGERLARALETMGPVFIKFGQALSMRPDILPRDIVAAVTRLQDHVEPFDGKFAKQIIEKDFNCKLNEIFSSFDELPIAAASIANVHSARLLNNELVAVKVLRPGIQTAVNRDIDLLYKFVSIINNRVKNNQRLKLTKVVDEIANHLQQELDLTIEAANASAFARSLDKVHNFIKVPKVHWQYVSANVMVMEKISGVPILDIAELKKQKVNLEYLAKQGLDLFFQQVFENNFFHADMHGGNVFVDTSNPDKPSYICVDFGIMGSLSKKDKLYIAENLVAFFNRDYNKVATLHIESNWLPNTTRVDHFASAIRTVSEPIFALPLAEISFGKLLLSLFKTARKFDVEIQPQLILLQKTLLNVESLARTLYPDLNLWATAKPYLENWVKGQFAWPKLLDKTKHNLPVWLSTYDDLPQLIYRNLTQPPVLPKPDESVKLKVVNNGRLISFLLGIFATSGMFILLQILR